MLLRCRQVRGFLFSVFALLAGCTADPAAEAVGRQSSGRIVTPVNQWLTPYGRLVDMPGLRPQALLLSPDGRLLFVSGKTHELLVLDPASGEVRQRVPLPSARQTEPEDPVSPRILAPDKEGQLSFTGLVGSADGTRIYLSDVSGSIKVFAVGSDGTVRPSHSIPLPPANAPRRSAEIPSGLCLSADGKKLYVCGNLSNTLLELELPGGRVLRTFPVGVAPFDVRLLGDKAYVSNWGGRRPMDGDLIGPAGQGTVVRVDPVRHVASEGSVSVIDLRTGLVRAELITGLHSSALALSPDGRHLVCANAASDHLSVIDTAADQVIATVWMKAKPSDLFGATPNALCFAPDGRTLYVANGTQNAIAVVHFEPDDPGDTKLQGLIPAGWFPGALLFDASRSALIAANLKGLGPGRPRKGSGAAEFNSHQYHGSLSIMPLPPGSELPALSELAMRNLRRPAIAAALEPPRTGQPPRPMPERIGEPSPIRHVVYVIKENRTYDQVLGDLREGNGDPELCIFGEQVTPNQHALARQFVVLDNTYCSGILSADGHQWSTAAIATDYLEKSFAGFPRSYPDGMGDDDCDALSYSPAGFLWDNAIAHGVSLCNYGEFCGPKVHWRRRQAGEPEFLDCWRTWKGQDDAVVFGCEPVIASLLPYSPRGYVGWEMAVPDQFRADFFLAELRQCEQRGEFPRLTIVCLPNDHTSGTRHLSPTPAACVADNDLAFGRIVEGLSRCRFWPEMLVIGIEDDPQNGWDHVSGYRTTAYLASPYVKRGARIGTQYNTTSVVRTIEQILGLPPMNQFDASASPMADCFTDTPDLTPFTALPANVPLDQMNPQPAAIADPQLRQDAVASAGLDLTQPDRVPEELLNAILWRAVRGTSAPFPHHAVHHVVDDQ